MGFTIDASGQFILGKMNFPRKRLARTVWDAEQGQVTINRAMPARDVRKFRLLARNAWSGEGLVEFYVDDVLSLPVTIKGAHLSGAFAPLGTGVNISSAHRLSLPAFD